LIRKASYRQEVKNRQGQLYTRSRAHLIPLTPLPSTHSHHLHLRSALAVPLALRLAGTLGTGRGARVPVTTALTIERDGTTTGVATSRLAAAGGGSRAGVGAAAGVAAGAGERGGAGDLVGAAIHGRLARAVVDADDDARVVGRVGAGEGDEV
jgi:hypothetical protein